MTIPTIDKKETEVTEPAPQRGPHSSDHSADHEFAPMAPPAEPSGECTDTRSCSASEASSQSDFLASSYYRDTQLIFRNTPTARRWREKNGERRRVSESITITPADAELAREALKMFQERYKAGRHRLLKEHAGLTSKLHSRKVKHRFHIAAYERILHDPTTGAAIDAMAQAKLESWLREYSGKLARVNSDIAASVAKIEKDVANTAGSAEGTDRSLAVASIVVLLNHDQDLRRREMENEARAGDLERRRNVDFPQKGGQRESTYSDLCASINYLLRSEELAKERADLDRLVASNISAHYAVLLARVDRHQAQEEELASAAESIARLKRWGVDKVWARIKTAEDQLTRRRASWDAEKASTLNTLALIRVAS